MECRRKVKGHLATAVGGAFQERIRVQSRVKTEGGGEEKGVRSSSGRERERGE